MFAASLILVFGTVALFVSIVFSGGTGIPPGTRTLMHAATPWPFVIALAVGGLLGLAALWRRRTWGRGGVVVVEILLVFLGMQFFFADSRLPHHELSLGIGDPFPAYELPDQDGRLRSGPADGSEKAKLFIFYRGDW
jgi:hypothetical protein